MNKIFMCPPKPNHECDALGETIYFLKNGERIKKTDKDFEDKLGDIVGGSGSCSICGATTMEWDEFLLM